MYNSNLAFNTLCVRALWGTVQASGKQSPQMWFTGENRVQHAYLPDNRYMWHWYNSNFAFYVVCVRVLSKTAFLRNHECSKIEVINMFSNVALPGNNVSQMWNCKKHWCVPFPLTKIPRENRAATMKLVLTICLKKYSSFAWYLFAFYITYVTKIGFKSFYIAFKKWIRRMYDLLRVSFCWPEQEHFSWLPKTFQPKKNNNRYRHKLIAAQKLLKIAT